MLNFRTVVLAILASSWAIALDRAGASAGPEYSIEGPVSGELQSAAAPSAAQPSAKVPAPARNPEHRAAAPSDTATVPPETAPAATAVVEKAAPPSQAVTLPAKKPAAPPARRKPPQPKEKPQAQQTTAAKKDPPTTRDQQCTALARCREAFAKCRFSNQEKGPDGWEIHKEACAEEYQTCIDKGFPKGGMTFTRWFLPYDPCN